MRLTGPLESVALLTVLPVPARAATSTRGVLPWAPLVGVVLGGIAAGIGVLGDRWVSPFVGAVLAVGVLAALTRGLHLDGLADTADGLGPLRDRARALQVMRQSDVGPFGVAALVLTLLLQVACLAVVLPEPHGWLALWTAVVVARLAMARTGLPGVAVAEGSALGSMVQGTVSAPWLGGNWLVLLGFAAATTGDVEAAARLAAAAVAGLLAGELLYRRARRRLGGVTGDVMGAMGETAATATLLVAAALLV
jgi:adenosylcobinamide-GDP ribazoletransferase